MAPIMKESATILKESAIGIAVIDATADENSTLKTRFDIQRFPTFKLNNTKFGSGIEDSTSFKTKEDLLAFMNAANQPLIKEITSTTEVTG
jgi:hypothetical protein